ncbi:MAG: ribosome biogenesis GTP-binding protein YihA/YsxC, partial [Cytophagales bacterium]|nr:ribosome biogenesis GTP-binding protein YihA/YsxC [Cytophagales bacterium]
MYLIKTSEFFKSSSMMDECPAPDKPEYALIGRSNVGKSSLLNMLTGRNSLAMVSAKPGKTKLINHFLMDKKWYLVDLPGYGWAKISKTEKEKWGSMTRYYLKNRANLMYVFVLIDSRLEPQKIDIEFCNWLGENQIPFVLVFTKCDKNSAYTTGVNVKKFNSEL